jgi:hypothetical protein
MTKSPNPSNPSLRSLRWWRLVTLFPPQVSDFSRIHLKCLLHYPALSGWRLPWSSLSIRKHMQILSLSFQMGACFFVNLLQTQHVKKGTRNKNTWTQVGYAQ